MRLSRARSHRRDSCRSIWSRTTARADPSTLEGDVASMTWPVSVNTGSDRCAMTRKTIKMCQPLVFSAIPTTGQNSKVRSTLASTDQCRARAFNLVAVSTGGACHDLLGMGCLLVPELFSEYRDPGRSLEAQAHLVTSN